MPDLLINSCPAIKNQAQKSKVNVSIVCPSDKNYDKDREISNSRLDFHPSGIGYCGDSMAVSWCLQWCIQHKIPFRVRSGGHHHEGMCSGNGVFIIDLSKLSYIDFSKDDPNKAWIGAGTSLNDVYHTLESHNKIIPGGACESVCIGGLAQGGGWGLSIRKLGFTCDNLLEAEIVLPDGMIVMANKDNKYSDLFWAIRGGGGGNFGIVTRFLMKLTPLQGYLTTFQLNYYQENMHKITSTWMKIQSGFPEELSSICRLKVIEKGKETPQNTSVLLAGQYYGDIASLKDLLKPFYSIAPPVYDNYATNLYPAPNTTSQQPEATLKSGLQNAHFSISKELAHINQAAPGQTCDVPHPHKVSSTFPKHTDYENLTNDLANFILNSDPIKDVNTYVSLMCLGGKVKTVAPNATAFPYRDKEFMIQYQAWSGTYDKNPTEKYLEWIRDFRIAMIPHTEGSFINFPDKDICENPNSDIAIDSNTWEGRIALLKVYYAQNLPQLMKVKTKYDPSNYFSFGMSIPLLK